MADLLLLRHGESEWNASRRYQGQADPRLSRLGEEQARVGAGYVPPVDLIASSDLRRARRTAELIRARLGRPAWPERRDPPAWPERRDRPAWPERSGLPPLIVDAALRERSVGDWTGLSKTEVERRWPVNGGVRPRPPGWEANGSVLLRVLPVLHQLADVAASVLVVTHGGVIYAIEEHLGEPWMAVPNLGGRWLRVQDGAVELGPRVTLLDPDDERLTVPLET